MITSQDKKNGDADKYILASIYSVSSSDSLY